MAESTIAPRWSVDLSRFGGRAAVADPSGRWFSFTETTLVSFTVDGQVQWEAPRLGPARGPIAFASDGSLLQIEGDQVVTRDGRSGQTMGVFHAPAHWLTLDPWGGILLNQTVLDQTGKTTAVLHRTDRSGAHLWSVTLASPALEFPTVVGEMVFVHSGGLLRALDSAGQPRMAIGHDGFHPPQTIARESAVADDLWHRPEWFGPTTVLVGLQWHSSPKQLFLVDPWAGAVAQYTAWLVPRHPVAVLPGGGPARVAMRGNDYNLRELEDEYSVVATDEAGRLVWEHRLHAPPTALAAGSAGTTIVAGSPSQRRWDDYHRRQDLSADTYVRCLGPDGLARWTWFAPGTQSQPMIGPDGTVYIVSESRLFALHAA
jgi:hypothetical protein